MSGHIDSTDYFSGQFSKDLQRILAQEIRGGSTSDRLSIVDLLPTPLRKVPGYGHYRVFDVLENKLSFLFSYYFCVLLDQAAHSAVREHHHIFEQQTSYPKFCGVLGLYWTNIDPILMLMAATLHVEIAEQERSLINFRALARYFAHQEAPAILQRFADGAVDISSEEIIRLVYSEAVRATSSSYVGGPLLYTVIVPDMELGEKWSRIAREEFARELAELSEQSS